MTIGVSKARLLELQIEGAHSECTYGFEQAIQLAIEECAELNPWFPIESAPKDRVIRLFYRENRSAEFDRLVTETIYSDLYKERSNRLPTYWQEITPDPIKGGS